MKNGPNHKQKSLFIQVKVYTDFAIYPHKV